MHSNERPVILFSTFFLAPARNDLSPGALTVAQQAKANAARAEAEAARPGEGFFMQRRVKPFISFLTPFSVLATPLGGAAAAEGRGSLNPLGMDCSS